ncbi:helix-turn-helix domain-containing protein [Streptomyces sp. NPDC056749]|uniref:helix-turn-helix domain-containing protein n=1 Tax=Streptomyces sp. NPDC056749 TaxID=3345936 RepID=UPI0036C233F3
MDTQQDIAPPCAPPGTTEDAKPSSGVVHINSRHTSDFTVIGNHLSRHRELSLVAIGLAVHIQSLPAGARIGIKRLAERFPESETRIAAALRELEAAGYLHRSRMRLPDGRVVTRTVSHNRPDTGQAAPPPPRPPERLPEKPPARTAPPPAPHEPAPTPEAQAPPPSAPVCVPAPTARTTPPPPVPQPAAETPELRRAATALLADLRRLAPQLVLSERDIATLVPGVATWLERDAHPDTVRHALTADLPVPLRHPAKLLRHRLTTLLPPPLPGAHDLMPPPRPGVIVIPLQNCDLCDRAFRSRHPGHCRDCRAETQAAA